MSSTPNIANQGPKMAKKGPKWAQSENERKGFTYKSKMNESIFEDHMDTLRLIPLRI